jgi:hypothetical protein
MSYWDPRNWLSSLVSSDVAETAEALVDARVDALAANTDQIAQVALKLRELHTQIRQKNPSLFEAFNSPETLTDRQVAEQLQIVVLATTVSELSEVSEASDQLEEEIEQLEAVVEV